MWALVGGSRDSGVRRGYFGDFQSSSTRNEQRTGWTNWAAQSIATQVVSRVRTEAEDVLQTERRAFSERTNEMAAVAHPVGMEVVTARCRNREEQRTGML